MGNTEYKIEQIKQAIDNGSKRQSKLSQEALEVPSLTSLNIRHIYNNLGSISSHFMEVGSHRGGSFCSFVYDNANLISAVAIDNFSENFSNVNVEEEFMSNAERFTPDTTNWKLVNKDSFKITKKDLLFSPDLYLYDGEHSAENQAKALTYFKKFLTKEFIFVCDDYSWERVKTGTQAGIKDAGLEVLFEQEFHTPEGGEPNEHFHNGLYIALLKQK